MNPYENLQDKAFWKLAVADKSMLDIEQIWEPKHNILQTDKIVTFGSCFAQHIGNALRGRGYNWFTSEPPPRECDALIARKYGYNYFSARTGNIYTTSLLKQWTEWALDLNKIPSEHWENDGRTYDPFRPTIEPNGFISKQEMKLSRDQTVKAFKECIESADHFVFTLGLTESWINRDYNYEYPMCPGTMAGTYDELLHKFENQQFEKILANLSETIDLMLQITPSLKFILTVSPVPLTATMSGKSKEAFAGMAVPRRR